MKSNTLMVTFLSAAAFAMGCSKETTTTTQIEKIQEKTEATAQDMKEYTYAQRAQYADDMRAQLAAQDREMEQLSIRVEKANEAARNEDRPKLQALRDQRARMNKQLDDIKDASESNWNSVKADSRKAFADMKDGFNRSRQWIRWHP
jgi:DNA anti-recombination protein RmuC